MEFPRRIEQVGKEPLVVMAADQGHRVYALANPKEAFMVLGLPDVPTCTCTESDTQEKCRHILAVESLLARKAPAEKQTAAQSPEKGPTPSKPQEPMQEVVHASENGSASPQMLLKRSVSPD